MLCSPAASAAPIASASGADSSPSGPGGLAAQIDDGDAGQRRAASARSGSSRRVNRPRATLYVLSSDGVAEPSTRRAPARCARTTARSRAW